jgi:sugar phosphate permease
MSRFRAMSTRPRRRWLVLSLSMFAQGAQAFSFTGLPVLGPAVQRHFELSLVELGSIFGAGSFGAVLTVALWGVIADRWGDRFALATGLGSGAVALAAVNFVHGYLVLLLLMALAGGLMAIASVGSGRALMGWFGPDELGLALGCRQMAIPLGGALAALILPGLFLLTDLHVVFWLLALVCGLPAIAVLLALGRPPVITASGPLRPPQRVLTDRRLWRLALTAALVAMGQVAMIAYLVVFLTSRRHLSLQAAALAMLVAQVVASGTRIGVGRLSDRLASRTRPLRWVAAISTVLFALTTLLLAAPLLLLLPAIVLATIAGMSANGVGYAAAAEIGGPQRAGAALGFQNTAMYLVGTLAPVIFGTTVANAGWSAGFGLLAAMAVGGWLLCGSLVKAEAAHWGAAAELEDGVSSLQPAPGRLP